MTTKDDLARMLLDLERDSKEWQRQLAETNHAIRLLFEEIVSRLKVLGEGKPGPAA